MEILGGLPKIPGGTVGWGRMYKESVYANEENGLKDAHFGGSGKCLGAEMSIKSV